MFPYRHWVTFTSIPLTTIKLHFKVVFFYFCSVLCNIWYHIFLIYWVPLPFKACAVSCVSKYLVLLGFIIFLLSFSAATVRYLKFIFHEISFIQKMFSAAVTFSALCINFSLFIEKREKYAFGTTAVSVHVLISLEVAQRTFLIIHLSKNKYLFIYK